MINNILPADAVGLTNGRPMTTSLVVSHYFKKTHKAVLDWLKNSNHAGVIICTYQNLQSEQLEVYNLNRDAFTELASSFLTLEDQQEKEILELIQCFHTRFDEIEKAINMSVVDAVAVKLSQSVELKFKSQQEWIIKNLGKRRSNEASIPTDDDKTLSIRLETAFTQNIKQINTSEIERLFITSDAIRFLVEESLPGFKPRPMMKKIRELITISSLKDYFDVKVRQYPYTPEVGCKRYSGVMWYPNKTYKSTEPAQILILLDNKLTLIEE